MAWRNMISCCSFPNFRGIFQGRMSEAELGAHTIKSHGASVARNHRHDWLILLLLVVTEIILYMINPFYRFVGEEMMVDLKLPLKPNTVPVWAVPMYSILLPIVIFLFFYIRQNDVYDLHHSILGLLFAVLITGVLTDAIKDAVGRPRPDFFWRCFPDGIPKYDDKWGNVICHGNPSDIKEGYKSFPSGHTSWSFAGLGFLSWYLAGKIQAFDRRGHISKLCIVFFPLLLASLVGVSRVDDYWHHWPDVFAAALIGLVVTTFCYLQFFPLPNDTNGWGPYAYFRKNSRLLSLSLLFQDLSSSSLIHFSIYIYTHAYVYIYRSEMEESLLNFMELMKRPVVVETFVDILLCAVPIWVAVMIGLVIGWSWRPRWTGLVYLGLRSKLRFAWTLPPGFGARRLWFAFTALSAFSVGRTLWSRFRGKGKESAAAAAASGSDSPAIVSVDGSGGDIEPSTATSLIEDVVTEKGVEHLLNLLESKDGEMGWQNLMERSTSNMAYQAWRHEPETGPVVYRSRTVFEDATPELVRDFFWDDEFRPKWDPMLAHFKILEECPSTGTMIVHWIKKFPFFCSDREYIIGRRIWEDGKTYYCVTKGVPYPALQRSDKPRRVDLYFSSWVIKPVQSRRGDGQMTACEVTLVHYEDMGIPKDVAKLGVRHGMWGTVKKLHSGFRAYQQARKSEAPLSRSAVMAGKTTKIALEPTSSNEDEKGRAFIPGLTGDNGGFDWKWVAIGGAVAVVCGLQTGVIGKALLLGAGQRFARR